MAAAPDASRPDTVAVRLHLSRILSSPGFASSERLCRFLTLSVESALAPDDRRALKEYAIGREVFDRPEDYDPRLDPIVRVEARRLRKKLEEFYAGTVSGESIRIELPKGAYVARVSSTAEARIPRLTLVSGWRRHVLLLLLPCGNRRHGRRPPGSFLRQPCRRRLARPLDLDERGLCRTASGRRPG